MTQDDSREQLIAAAFAAAMEHYGEQLPAYDGDLRRWLCATCEAAHRMNASFGPGYWELTSRSDLPPDLAAAEQRRRLERRNAMARIASTVWHAAGHDGNPPDPLVAAVGARLSPHFTAAVMTDVGQQWQTTAELAYAAIIATLHRQTAPDVAD
ncbi:hypothetical protein MXD62_22635 [Frankia sp. Mgl5]|uniref:hypothetical protein n=1 Tax=Frankia sp. Mgl5 TaxID=2933793 RepID=UPI00200FA663|nr:hypothetical protein [Frankia sp. Mgl5]MCK9929925.1 hypothetical protein [Frankia sp. Mgl5]